MAALTGSTHITALAPTGDESLFEAFHAIYSALASSFYSTSLKKYFGIRFIYENLARYVSSPFLFCPQVDSTHYKYKDTNDNIHDPFEMYQLPNSNGNCIFFALYIALTHKNITGIPLPKLYNLKTNKLITKVDGYWKVVPKSGQLAYNCFVHNDFEIFKWVFHTLKLHEFPEFKREWAGMNPNEKKRFGISKGCTLDNYISDFEKLMTISESYKMTFDQVKQWDEQSALGMPPYENTGIEGGVDQDDYILNTPHRLQGGRKKTRSKHRRTTV